MIKTINYFLQSLLVYISFLIGRILGINISRKLFSLLFLLIGPVFKSRKIINYNLEIFNNKIHFINKKEIISGMWKNYGKTFVEYVFLNYLKRKNSHIIVKGEENLIQLNQNKKSVIFISGHFANFELMSMELTKMGVKLATIYRPLNNFFLNPFMEYLRKKYICKNQIKKGLTGVKHSIEYLRKNYSIALMIDQRVSEGVKLPFFEHKALTTTLPAQLALKHKYNIVPIYISRDKNDNFEMEIYKPLDVSSKENTEKNKLEISMNLNKIIEKMILKDPSQWIWTHNRWK